MDIYDQEVQRLTENPRLIENSWALASPLFKYVGSTDLYGIVEGEPSPGCLTQIRTSPKGKKAYINGIIDEALTKEIANDERIPKEAKHIEPSHLSVFAEWQRKIDALHNA